MKNNITTLNEKDLFEIIQRQQLETIERQARELEFYISLHEEDVVNILDLEFMLKGTTERLERVLKRLNKNN